MPNLDDLKHDMTFTLEDETFVIKNVRPEVLAEWEEEEDKPSSGSAKEALERLDRQIIAFLGKDEDAVKRYKALRAREDDAVPMWKLVEFAQGMVATQMDRPTTPPSPSDAGRGPTVVTSKAA